MQKDKLVLEDYETFSVRGKNRIVIFQMFHFGLRSQKLDLKH